MSEIVPLGKFAYSAEPVPEIVEMLECLLEEAKRGEIRAAAVVSIDGSQTISSTYHQGNIVAALVVAGVTKLLHEMCEVWTEQSRSETK